MRASDDAWESTLEVPLAIVDGVEDGWVVGAKVDETVADAGLAPVRMKYEPLVLASVLTSQRASKSAEAVV